ncbi:hypothetical protein ABIE67_009397 [Streptomyces sp. V4I8]
MNALAAHNGQTSNHHASVRTATGIVTGVVTARDTLRLILRSLNRLRLRLRLLQALIHKLLLNGLLHVRRLRISQRRLPHRSRSRRGRSLRCPRHIRRILQKISPVRLSPRLPTSRRG